LKPLRKRILGRLQRGQNWLDQAREEFEQNRPRAGERKLELAMAELRLAREKSEFWGWQQPRRKRRMFPLVAGLCCVFLLVGVFFVFYPGNPNYRPEIAESLEVERQLSLPIEYGSRRREPRILDNEDLNSIASYRLEREIEGLIVPADL